MWYGRYGGSQSDDKHRFLSRLLCSSNAWCRVLREDNGDATLEYLAGLVSGGTIDLRWRYMRARALQETGQKRKSIV